MKHLQSEDRCKTNSDYLKLREALHEISLELERIERESHRTAKIEDLYPLADLLGICHSDLVYFFV